MFNPFNPALLQRRFYYKDYEIYITYNDYVYVNSKSTRLYLRPKFRKKIIDADVQKLIISSLKKFGYIV